MNKVLLWLLLSGFYIDCIGQNINSDSFHVQIAKAENDTSKVQLLLDFGWNYPWSKPDTAIQYGLQAMRISQELQFDQGEIKSTHLLSEAFSSKGNFSKALEVAINGLRLAEKTGSKDFIDRSLLGIGSVYFYTGDYYKALNAFTEYKKSRSDTSELLFGFIGETYFYLNQLDSALIYINKAYEMDLIDPTFHWSVPYFFMAAIEVKKGKLNEALENYRIGIKVSLANGINLDITNGYNRIAALFKQMGLMDSAIYYAKKSMAIAQKETLSVQMIDAAGLLAEIYIPENIDSAFHYQRVMLAAKDSLFSNEKMRQLQNVTFNEQIRQQEMQAKQQEFQSKIKIYGLFAAALLFIVIIFFLYRNNRYKQKAYTLLQQQKREIEIQNEKALTEAALERVRLSAMAMHNSNDVGNAIAVLFNELDKLGIVTLRCGIVIIDQSKTMEVWTAGSANDGGTLQTSGKLDMTIHPMLRNLFNSWKTKETFFSYELMGEDLIDYYHSISNSPGYNIKNLDIKLQKQVATVFFFREGGLYTYTLEPINPSSFAVLEKFAAVFGLTYRRYLDLRQAEEQTREAVRQSALDKVRAEIASMRSTDDLQRITPLIWRQLTMLHVPFVRCGIFIVDEKQNKIQLYFSSPDGHSLGVLNLDINQNDLTRNSFEHWKKNSVYLEHWNKEQFANWIQSMIDLGQVQDRKTYQGDEPLPESLYLHIVPFTQGMLYVGNTSPLTADEIQLLKSLAEAFAIAYARYEDFKQLEDAKNQIEVTLTDLKSAQSQLIQSEKMASLGELTAGIAHEIQNPLNFVNNFSEVNIELIGEMNVALSSGDTAEALEIIRAVQENEQKIVYHGKRAESIVKGMLQHSRKSDGKKEPVDINSLCDEYLRLSYHGLKAKDKSFQAGLHSDFDPAIGQVPVMGQDLGRVLLNLYNNAFYAVADKKKQAADDFVPTVSVSTKKINLNGKGEGIEITIRDNGLGIPSKIADKIFQPFFTTKPAGQGTGLGLSMSYDIITKGHQGELSVHSIEGEFAEFKIVLPL